MVGAVRSRLTFANVVACACLFVVLGGDSVAAGAARSAAKLVTGKTIKDNSVTGADVKNASLTGKDLKDASVTLADLAPGVALAGPKGDAGAKGEPGAKGETGAKGDSGVQGPPGLSGLEIVSVTSATDSTGYKAATATCPAGKTPISGGSSYAANEAPAALAVASSEPVLDGATLGPGEEPNGWKVAMNEEAGTAAQWHVTAYALCANAMP